MKSFEADHPLLDGLLEGFQVVGPDFRYLYVNAAAARHGRTTPEALLGRTMTECYPGIETTEVFGRIARCLSERAAHVMENAFTHADGSVARFELRIEPVPQGACIMSLDVTARHEAEERLRRAQRVETLGRLAAGVAHDFNNFLGIMLAHGEAALTRPGGPERDDVEGIMLAARRSIELTSQLLAFGRRQVQQRRLVDPAAMLAELEPLLARSLGDGIALTVGAGSKGLVDLDRSRLEQVVTNLVVNARDAMPAGGRLTVTTEDVAWSQELERDFPDAAPGRHVLLSIADTGTGMDEETAARIFEPFFTTKAQGRGTGLGLSMVHGIVLQSGGSIRVRTAPGCGTTFQILLPRGEPVAREPEGASAQRPAPPSAGPERVLVAEDDDQLRVLAGRALERARFDVVLASSGPEALEACARHDAVAVLVTDMSMPGMHGTELIERARRIHPSLGVVCTSGCAPGDLGPGRVLPDDVEYLEKPYLPSALVQRVRSLVGAA